MQRQTLRGTVIINQEVQHEGMFDELNLAVLSNCVDERTADLDACCVATCVRYAIAMVPTLTRERQRTGVVDIKGRSPTNEATNCGRTLVGEHSNRIRVT